MDTVTELEHYLAKHTLDELVKEMMVSTLKDKPEEPAHYLLKWLLLKLAGKGSEEVAVACCSTSQAQPPAAAGASTPNGETAHVAVCHSNRKTQQYLIDKKVPAVLLEFLKQLCEEQPDNPLSFIALQAHNLHKSAPEHLQPNPTPSNTY